MQTLTGSAPETRPDAQKSLAGITHSWNLKTAYFTAEIPIWIDEIARDPASQVESSQATASSGDKSDADKAGSEASPELHDGILAWKSDFLTPDAAEVIRAVGAWVVCFQKPVSSKDTHMVQQALKAVSEVIEEACGSMWDGTCLAVAMKQSVTPHLDLASEEWDNICADHGFEFIDAEGTGKNEYGEKTGVDRVREALEATDWAMDDDFDDVDGFEVEAEDFESHDLSGNAWDAEQTEMNAELWGLKASLLSRGEDDGDDAGLEEEQVEEMSRMMSRLQAAKDTTAGMPEEEKRRFAARAVRDLMKELG